VRTGALQLACAANLGEVGRMSAPAPLKHPDAKTLRKAALGYPGVAEEFPWDHHAYKTPNKKAFLFLTGRADGGFTCTMKLPYRNEEALRLKGAEPTGYGMAKSGWVTFVYSGRAKPPMTKLIDYLDESWRAVAPKKLSRIFAPPQPRKSRKAP
jgi:predicted DNA-binding protein (MmcQ/YjbR family)